MACFALLVILQEMRFTGSFMNSYVLASAYMRPVRDVSKGVSVFEVDGALSRQYAENLCFLSKLFLDHKTLRHPVYLFLFYIVTEQTKEGG